MKGHSNKTEKACKSQGERYLCITHLESWIMLKSVLNIQFTHTVFLREEIDEIKYYKWELLDTMFTVVIKTMLRCSAEYAKKTYMETGKIRVRNLK